MTTKPIPFNLQTITPMLALRGAAKAIEFYKTAFGAVETLRLEGEDGSVDHAELKFGAGSIMLAEENADYNRSPATLGGSSVILHLYVDDVDQFFERAVAGGAQGVKAPEDQFYGDRSCRLLDPFGYTWIVATPIEAVTNQEMQERYDQGAQS